MTRPIAAGLLIISRPAHSIAAVAQSNPPESFLYPVAVVISQLSLTL
jgi:hypothetical protein